MTGFRDVRAGERVAADQALEEHRASARWAVARLSDDQARRTALPHSQITAGGILKHLARMEDLWFCRKMAGQTSAEPWSSHHTLEDWDFRSAREDTVAELLALYDQACERSRQVQAAHLDLDSLATQPSWGEVHVSLRWIYLHLIEESAQHVGHLDLLGDALAGSRPCGDPSTRLVILRGNSGSGKTTMAHQVQLLLPHRACAVVSQDLLRRTILRSHDNPGNPSIDLIDVTARFALDRGIHVIVEGILTSARYGDMLRRLAADHRGQTRCFYLDVPLEETLRRHATKTPAPSFGETEMRSWYAPLDLVPGLDEHLIPSAQTLPDSVALVGGFLEGPGAPANSAHPQLG